jgi:hypothetical protein
MPWEWIWNLRRTEGKETIMAVATDMFPKRLQLFGVEIENFVIIGSKTQFRIPPFQFPGFSFKWL